MRSRSSRASLLVVCGLAAATLVVPSSALANNVVDANSSASCTLVGTTPTISISVSFEGFSISNKPVEGTVKIDGAIVKTYSAADGTGVSWDGPDFTLVYNQSVAAGQHTIRGDFTWPGQKSAANASVERTVDCPAPPSTPPTAPPVTPPSGGGTLPESIASGRARLRGPSGCVRRAFRARVTGRSVARVRFYIDGKLVKTITGKHAVYSLKVRPSRYGIGRHRVVARVRFLSASNTAARRLRLTFTRCSHGAIAPRFTG